ncbi:MAG: lysophospholipid acyltransferase family protein [bacterium]|nr:lysophospholipid acyltransferase family protein [bacterium]
MIYYKFVHIVFNILAHILFGLEKIGIKNFPEKGPVILASNHISFLDPMIIPTASSRRMHSMAKAELFNVPVLGWLMKKFWAFPVKRGSLDMAALKNSINVLRGGDVLLLFPEGTRSLDGDIHEAKPGIGFIVYHSKVPVVPVLVKGTDKALPKGAWLPRPKKVKVIFGKPVYFDSYFSQKGSKETYSQIGNDIMSAIKALRENE